jgi:Tfp pilus assembly PilM family ATPase/Tfp pilus assembly protein PilN
MVDKILGLDIGEDAIKAVLVIRSFRGGYRAVDAAIAPIEHTGGVPGALQELFKNQNFRGCPCATALSVQNLSFRNLVLPFRDEKKIRQVLTFEVEPLLHFAVDDAILDFIVVHQGAPSNLLVAIAPKTTVQERATHLTEYVKRISHLNVEGAAIAAVLHAQKPSAGCVLLLDIGAGHSAGLLIQNGRICQVRPFAFGGNLVTQTIAQTLRINADEAEQRKRENRPGQAGEAIAALCDKFFSEVDHTIEFMRLHGYLQHDPERIYFTGGGALYPPFRDALSKHFRVPVEPVDLLAGHAIPVDQAFSSRWTPPVMNQALALAIAGHKRGLGFDIKMQDSKVMAAVAQHKGTLRRAAAVLLLILILAGADAYLDYRYNRQRLDALKAEITTLFKTLNPEVTRIVDPVSQLKGNILEARKVTLGIDETRPGATVLALLKDISSLAPPATELTVNAFTLENDTILLKGQAKNFDAVDTLKNEFMKSKFFQAVTIGGTNLLKQGDKVEFDLRITLKR